MAKLDDPIIITDIEEEFYIGIIENLKSEPRSLQFLLTTIKKKDCENYRIQYNTDRIANRLKLSIRDIAEPEDCIPGEAPAFATADLGPLSAGYYRLTVDLKETVFNEGQISVLDDRYSIKMENKEGIIFLQQELLKVPKNTAWGYVTFQSPGDAVIADQLIETLANTGEQGTFRKGYYGHFHILDDSGRVAISNQPAATQIKTFLFHFPSQDNKQAFKETVDSFRNRYTGAIEIRVFDDKGEEL